MIFSTLGNDNALTKINNQKHNDVVTFIFFRKLPLPHEQNRFFEFFEPLLYLEPHVQTNKSMDTYCVS